MITLLIIADDLTGALDTGIQFARLNAKTKVFAKNEINSEVFHDSDTEVLVVNTESRHVTPEKAYESVYHLSKMAVEAGVKYIYKKTDSALRGNIGRELTAVLEASKEKLLAFIPALPPMNRVTIDGIQYIDGIPVHESVFGRDPYNPVKSSLVMDLFVDTTYNTVLYKRDSIYNTSLTEPTVGIFDAQTDDDLRRIGRHLHISNQLKAIAGCTGFAAILPEIIGINRTEVGLPIINKPLLVICGSVNPISKKQIEYGEKMGFNRVVLSPDQIFDKDFLSSEAGEQWFKNINDKLKEDQVVMIDSGISHPSIIEDYISRKGIDMEEARSKITRALGTLLEKFYIKGLGYQTTVMIIGGDTLMGFIDKVDCDEINPLCEIAMGTVLSLMNIFGKYAQVITKSGGFGSKEIIYDIACTSNSMHTKRCKNLAANCKESK